MTARFHLASAALALSLIAPGASAQQGRDDATFTWAKELAAGSQVTIRNGSGPITVRETTGNRVEVHASKIAHGGSMSDVAFDAHESSGGIEVCTLYGGQSDCGDRYRGSGNIRVRVDYTVLVPRTMRVSISTGNGDVSIERAGADVVANTGNGRVNIGETSGRVEATSGNGDVTIESANGPVKVSTGNGRVSVNTASGPVSATTGNGSVDVHMKTLTTDSDMNFSSGSGSLRITLPGEFNGRIDATSGSGTLRSDFEISVMGRLDAHHVRGTIGKGGPLIRLTTGSGEIELRKN